MKVGFARADVTPAIGKEVPGSLCKRFSTSFHDALYASAMVIEDGDNRVALVGLDNLSVRASVVKAARAIIEAKTGIPAGNVMVGCSHTHAGGPGMGALPGEFSRASNPELCERLAQEHATSADPCYLEELKGQIASAVIAADQRKQEALLHIGRGCEATVAFNRRFIMKDGTQMTHPGKGNPDIVEPAGPVDPEVGVLSAWTPDRKFLGALVSFTLHGTVGTGGISSDWIHYMRETVTRALDPDSVVVFLNGACGDVTQVDNLSMQESEFGEKWAWRIGTKVGAEALKVIADAEPGEMTPLAAKQKTIKIKTREVGQERYEQALRDIDDPDICETDKIYVRDLILLHEQNKWEPEVDCEIQAIQVGPVVFLANPAEYFCQFGLNIKHRSPFPFTYVVELANGCIGYVPTAEALGPMGGGYEPRLAMSSKLVPEAGQMIEDASVELAETLTPGEIPPRPRVPQAGKPWGWGASKSSTT